MLTQLHCIAMAASGITPVPAAPATAAIVASSAVAAAVKRTTAVATTLLGPPLSVRVGVRLSEWWLILRPGRTHFWGFFFRTPDSGLCVCVTVCFTFTKMYFDNINY